MMAIAAGGLDISPLSDLLHTVVAFAALFGMLAIAVAGSQALKAANDTALRALSKWALAAWVLWVAGVCLGHGRIEARSGSASSSLAACESAPHERHQADGER